MCGWVALLNSTQLNSIRLKALGIGWSEGIDGWGGIFCAVGSSLLAAFSPVVLHSSSSSSSRRYVSMEVGRSGLVFFPAVALSHISHIHTYHLSSLCEQEVRKDETGMGGMNAYPRWPVMEEGARVTGRVVF